MLQESVRVTLLRDKWHSIGSPLATTAAQLRRFHVRESSLLGAELNSRHQRDLWLGLGVVVGLVLIGAAITVQVARKIQRLIGLQLASEGQFKSMIESAPDAIVIANDKDDIVLINEHTEKIFGYTRQELIGTSTDLLIPENLQSAGPSSFSTYLNRQQPFAKDNKVELKAKHKNGQEFPVEISFSILQSNDGPLIASAIRDISSRKRNEHALEYLARSGVKLTSKDDFFSNCVQNLAEAFHAKYAFIGLIQNEHENAVSTLAVCSDGEIVDNFQYSLCDTPCEQVLINEKKMIPQGAMTRYPKDELLQEMGMDAYFGAPLISSNGKKFGLVVIGHTAPLAYDHWAELLLDIYAVRIANELEKIEIEDELSKQHEHLEELVSERTLELENSNQGLKSALKELEAFSYSVSHDLRSPLRALDGYSQILIEDYGAQLDSTAQEHLKRIRSASTRMGNIIDGLQNLTRIKVQALQPETLDLSAIAHEIVRSLSDNEPSRHVQWVIKDGLVCKADAGLMQIMLQNLLENAWKYTSQKADAKIEFGVNRNNKEPTYFVADNGIGFDMQYADKLFNTFTRLHSDEDGFTGMGIGLATVYRIIERHNGQVWAEAGVNEGARFYFTLG
jgi:PAS domain S-box-containing protein